MLQWFWNWFRPRDAFLPTPQDYYPYWDGQRMRKGDPFQLLRKLYSAPEMNFDQEWKLAAQPTALSLDALANVIRAVRLAFDVKPIDEGGLLDTQCKDLILHFFAWVEKKNPPTLSRPIFTPPIPEPVAAGSSPETGSDSAKISADSRPETLMPSCSASP